MFLILLVFAHGGRAQSASDAGHPAEVEVLGVSFQRVRAVAGESWWEAAVELRVTGGRGDAGRFANRVRVGFNLAIQQPFGAKELQFYRSAVTAPALGVGRQVFRFYLPPEVVERDRITRDARFWTVDLGVAGKAVPRGSNQVSDGFSSVGAVANFTQQLVRNAAANDGVLRPRHLTPFNQLVDQDPTVLRPTATDRAR